MMEQAELCDSTNLSRILHLILLKIHVERERWCYLGQFGQHRKLAQELQPAWASK